MLDLEHKIEVSRIFQASVEDVWNVWVKPELVQLWWGPDGFTSPFAQINFGIGKTSLVSMQAPPEIGGQVHYNTWDYIEIKRFERIVFIMNLADENGNRVKPEDVGMPEDFPKDVRTVVTFESISPNETRMTVTEYAIFGQISHFAQVGLEQSMDKMYQYFDKANTDLKQIFINLPVSNPIASMEFYAQLGFANYRLFSDEHQKCMFWSDQIYVMLHSYKMFKSNNQKTLPDTKQNSTSTFTLPVKGVDELNAIVENGLKAGGKEILPLRDEGFMQIRGIEDLDGHRWDFICLDLNKFKELKQENG